MTENGEPTGSRSELINTLGEGRVSRLLIEAGYSTVSQVANAPDEELLDKDGIGDATLEEIRESIPLVAPMGDTGQELHSEAGDEDNFIATLRDMAIPHPPGGTFRQVYPIEGADYVEAKTTLGHFRLYVNVPEEEYEWEQLFEPETEDDEPAMSARVRRIKESQAQ